ncbi:MarR family winged helix-turn-helix transcriptional regulator [Embleya sp. NBC_00888]|uniref:MarR family winged helix-turn-helix transcriptional regulator n=1 Tax=Embleya sp. NBC_00888 TaxID=2975960 RepID=UPI003867F28A|nr:MarR family winged helix-turn-helix transcriptional regulator [Embleya sp. NBC_00888]
MKKAAVEHTTQAKPHYFPRLAEERVDIALCRAAAAMARAADAHAAGQEVGVGQHLVLKMLDAVGPSAQQALAEELRIDRSVMVGIVDSLQKGGLVRRDRDPVDRRAYAVTITAAGTRVLTDAERDIPDFLDRSFAALTAAERRQLTTLLGKLLAK